MERVLLAAHLLPAKWVALLEAQTRGNRMADTGDRAVGAVG